jgi:TatA/E family protein of Tat protein translocase
VAVGSIGPAEIIVVLIVGLIVLGPNRLPDAAKQIGKAVSEFRKVTSGLQAEMRDAFTDPLTGTPPVPPAPTSAAVAGSVAAAGTLDPTITEVGAQATTAPAPWANPAIPVEGPPPSANANSANGNGNGNGNGSSGSGADPA